MPHYPIYDIKKSYAENVAAGPQFSRPIPAETSRSKAALCHFMGYEVASPLGVPAGPLLTSDWTTLAARLGFDVITYKTIRSKAHPGHPLPNVIFVKTDPRHPNVAIASLPPEEISEITITNSFGMPSMPSDFLQSDIAKARDALPKGKILIVSVVGTPGNAPHVTDDFVRTAEMAKEAGAHIIEANFSCPNISSKEGALYCDPVNAFEIASKIAKAIHPLPLLIKMGACYDKNLLRDVLISLRRANVRGICGINTISMSVVNADKTFALGKGRETGGICGNEIRPAALQFIREAAEIIAEEKLDLELAGCGGIMLPHHFDEFLNAGAAVAMTATGMMWDPLLALKWKNKGINI
jgi:dihydroorotate dehydrogenase